MKPEQNNNQLTKAVKLTQEQMLKILDWAYTSTINGLPGQKNVYEFVDGFLEAANNNREKAITRLVVYQTTKAATSGFITGFGGILTLPVTLPANKATVLFFQMRMIAAIALLRGYDLLSGQVQPFVYACLTGKTVSDTLKNTGIVMSNRVVGNAINKVPAGTLRKINNLIGFRLVTKVGGRGVIKLSRMIPVFGGLVGAGFDTTTTLVIANISKKTFTVRGLDLGDGHVLQWEDDNNDKKEIR